MSGKKKKEEATANLAAELVEDIKVTYDIPVNERIRLPIVWERITTGYRIQDLQPSKYQEAIELIKTDYFRDEVLCRGINVSSDDEAIDEYLNHFLSWIKDTQSLVAVEEGTGDIVGILVGRVLDRTVRTQWRFGLNDSVDNETKKELRCPNVLLTDSSSEHLLKDSTKSNPYLKKVSLFSDGENMHDKTIKSSEKMNSKEQLTQSNKKIDKINEKNIKSDDKLRSVEKMQKSVEKVNNFEEQLNIPDENYLTRGKSDNKLHALAKSEERIQKYHRVRKSTMSKTSVLRTQSAIFRTKSKSGDDYLPQGRRLNPIFCDENVIFKNEKLEKIHRLQGYLVRKYDMLELYDVPVYYNIYLTLVSPQHRNNGIAKALFRSIMEICRKFKCDVVCGVFTSKIIQNIAYKEGFMVREEVDLNEWLENDEKVFETEDQDDKIAFMSTRLKEPEVETPPTLSSPPRRHRKSSLYSH